MGQFWMEINRQPIEVSEVHHWISKAVWVEHTIEVEEKDHGNLGFLQREFG